MSYQVIARKWRPKAFDELVGQSHISQTLLNALKNDRLHHALLFTGPRGTGKTSTARILAKSLRCPNSKDFVPCNSCTECSDIAQGRSLDVIEIDGASNNGVDAIRELRDTVGYMPSSGTRKLYIIDEVHMLSTSAFNALLKTLEEPPEHVIFVMATTEVHKIPNTILSRCQRFDFRRIPLKAITERLNLICENDGIKAEAEALWMIARQGDGSLRDSQSLLDQVITFSEGQITQKSVIEVLGLTDRQTLTECVQAIVSRDVKKVIDVIDRVFTAGYDPRIFVQDLLEDFRNLLLVKLSPHNLQDVVDLPESEIQRLQELSQHLTEEDIHLLFDMALKGGNDIPKAQDTKVLLEMLMLRMAQAPRIRSLMEMANSAASGVAPVAPETRAQPSHVSSGALKTAETSTNSSSSSETEHSWLDFVQRIKSVNGMVGAKLEHTFLVNMGADKKVTIGVPEKMKFVRSQISDPDFLKKLNNYMKTFWGPGYTIEVSKSHSTQEEKPLTPQQLTKKIAQEKTDKDRQEVEEHPLVKETQSILKTKIQSINPMKPE